MSVLKKSTALFLSIVIVICSMLMNIGTVLAAERNESSSVLDNDEINDFSVPELNVTVDDENKWTNDINKLKITAPVSTEIYYKLDFSRSPTICGGTLKIRAISSI